MFKIEHKEGGVYMIYDYSKLSGKVKECCGSQAVFASKIGLSERTVSLKFNNQRDWKQDEIQKSCGVLGIKEKEIPIYFFTPKVQN